MKKYDYNTNTFGFEFPESQKIEQRNCEYHIIDEQSWQTDNFPN